MAATKVSEVLRPAFGGWMGGWGSCPTEIAPCQCVQSKCTSKVIPLAWCASIVVCLQDPISAESGCDGS